MVLVLFGCSDEPVEANAAGEEPVTASQGAPPQVPLVHVDAGRWADEAPMSSLIDYLQARHASMRDHAPTAELVSTSTFQWLQQQRQVIAVADQRGWTVPAAATVAVQRADVGGVDAVISLCLWGPSVDFVDESTGEPVRSTPAQWHPFDVKMVLASDRWLVAGAAQGGFRCEGEQP